MIQTISTNKRYPNVARVIGLLLLSVLASLRPDFSLILILGFFYAAVAYLRPNLGFILLIWLVPFSGTYYLSQNLGGLPGFKLINVCILMALFGFVSSGKRPKIEMKELLFLFGVLLLMFTSVFKSLPFLDSIGELKNVHTGLVGYINTALLKPILYLFFFIIIITFIRQKKEVEQIIKSIRVSLALLSCSILASYIFYIGQMGNFRTARSAIASIFGMHAGTLVEFYILGYPLVLIAFLYKKSLFNLLNVIICIISIALLYSRAAYAVTLFSTLAIPILGKKKGWLPALVLVAIIGVSIAPSSIVERGLTGIYGPDIDVHEFSAGRVDSIWIPLWNSIKDDGPVGFLFGRGMFSIAYTTDIPWGHAHNMYMEAFSDLGLLGLLFFLLFYIVFLKDIYKGLKSEGDEELKVILQGIFVAIISWLISGMAGRHFFPVTQNIFAWVLLGVSLAIFKISDKGVEHEQAKDMFRGPKRLPFTPK